eukprot:GFUD01042255.1.p1 GENE.GFUD01042255.1~~GFUD01042255.1.p1  ORF type:complete len:297 (+),score=16.53 GFUD01042255.1:60-950(+)
MDFNFKHKSLHPLFEFIQTQDAGNLVDCLISGDGCSSASISTLLSVFCPLLRQFSGWDGVILAGTSPETLNQLLTFFYSGRCHVNREQKGVMSNLLTSLGISDFVLMLPSFLPVSPLLCSTESPSPAASPNPSPSASPNPSPAASPNLSPAASPNTSTFTEPRSQKVEFPSRSKQDNLKCELCDIVITFKRNLGRHMKSAHGISTNTFSCDHCNISFKSNYDLNRHLMKSCPRNHKYKCNKCDKKFASIEQLNSHKKSNCKMKYSCDLCNQYFKRANQLSLHKVQDHIEQYNITNK